MKTKMENNNFEIRSNGNINATEESRTITGYAIVFDQESEYMGFYEIIKRGAVTQELVNNCDIFARFNHDEDKVLARSNHGQGSLKLTVDDYGLKYEFESPNTNLGNELIEYINRGDINKSSFCFSMDNEADSQKWEKREGKLYRTIYKIDKLYDIATVWQPAYSGTSVSCRDLDNTLEEIKNREEKFDNMMKELIEYEI